MKLLWQLVKIQITSYLTPSGQGTGSKKKRKPWPAWTKLLVPALACTYLSVMYSFLYFDGIGGKIGDYAMYMIAFLGLVMTLIGGLSMALGALYEFKDYDFLMSLPLSKRVIVASKLVAFYLVELVYAAFIMLPAVIIFGIRYMMDPIFYVMGVAGVFFFPMVPMVLACLLALAIRMLTAGKKHQKLFTNLLTFVFLIIYMVIVFRMNMAAEGAAGQFDFIFKVAKYVPTVGFYLDSMLEPNILKGLAAVAINVAAMVLFVIWLSPRIIQTNAKMRSTTYHDKNFRLKEAKAHSTVGALLRKEIAKTFSNIMYFLNLCLGQVMMLVGAGALLFNRGEVAELIGELSRFPDGMGMATMVLSMFVLAVALLTPVAAVSISLEGKYLWLLKTLPIRTEDVFLSKMAANFFIILIPSGLSAILVSIALQLPLGYAFVLFASTVLSAMFVPMLGLLINLLFPKMNWDREIVVIKQSMSSFVAIMGGMGLTALMLFVYFKWLIDFRPLYVLAGFEALLVLLVIILWIVLNTWGKKRFASITN